jgi:arylsulfatase A
VADEAVEWLANLRDQSRPFFLYVAFHEPHEPIATDPKFAATYKKLHPDDPSRVAYYGNVTQLDDAVGRILHALESQGLAGETFVFFTSDNGPARTRWHNAGSSGGLRAAKSSLYEGGIRVPGIVRLPGLIPAGSTSNQPVSGVDLLPTICELANVPLSNDRELDGASLVRLFKGSPIERRKPLYWQFISAPGPQVALRDGPWKLLATLGGPPPARGSDITEAGLQLIKSGRLTRFELYNLDTDPAETQNVAPTRPAELAELRRAMETFHAGVQADSPRWPLYANPGEEQLRAVMPDYHAKPLPSIQSK